MDVHSKQRGRLVRSGSYIDNTFNAPVAASNVSRIVHGTELQICLTAPLSSKDAQAGLYFEAKLAQEIVVEGGPALKAGTPVTGEVVAAKPAGRAQGKGSMEIRLASLSVYGRSFPIRTNGLRFEAGGTGKKQLAGALAVMVSG